MVNIRLKCYIKRIFTAVRILCKLPKMSLTFKEDLMQVRIVWLNLKLSSYVITKYSLGSL